MEVQKTDDEMAAVGGGGGSHSCALLAFFFFWFFFAAEHSGANARLQPGAGTVNLGEWGGCLFY